MAAGRARSYIEFAAEIRANRRYETGKCRSWFRFGPVGWLRSFCFHVRILLVYVVARRSIRLGTFDLEAYGGRSFASLRAVEGAGGKVCVTGLEHLAQVPGPVVFVGNHMSTLETLLLPGLILPFKDVAFVVKENLLEYPVFGPIMRAVKHIAVGRANPRDDLKVVLTRGQELLAAGVSVVIFPQATRSVAFDVSAFNSLGVKLASKAGVPVVPVALKTDFMGNGRVFKDLGFVDHRKPVHVAFGAPLQAAATSRGTHEAVVDFVRTHLEAWGGEVSTEGAA